LQAWLKPFHNPFRAKGKGRRVVAIGLSERFADTGVDRMAVTAANDEEEQDRRPQQRLLRARITLVHRSTNRPAKAAGRVKNPMAMKMPPKNSVQARSKDHNAPG
jgi:hypothetical protein